MRVVGQEQQITHTGKQVKKKKGVKKTHRKSVKTLNSSIGPSLLPGSLGKMRVVGKEKQTAHTGKQLKKKKGVKKTHRKKRQNSQLLNWSRPAPR